MPDISAKEIIENAVNEFYDKTKEGEIKEREDKATKKYRKLIERMIKG